jgi:hypothetical protein
MVVDSPVDLIQVKIGLASVGVGSLTCVALVHREVRILNAELLKVAAEKVGNANVLVNLVSKRVRQLNSAGGTGSRPLFSETAGLGVADIALTELTENKLGWEMQEVLIPETGPAKRRRRPT